MNKTLTGIKVNFTKMVSDSNGTLYYLTEEQIHQAIQEAIEAERVRIFKAIEEEYSWTLNVESTKNPMRLKVKSDYYIHINWKSWLKFKEAIMQEAVKGNPLLNSEKK